MGIRTWASFRSPFQLSTHSSLCPWLPDPSGSHCSFVPLVQSLYVSRSPQAPRAPAPFLWDFASFFLKVHEPVCLSPECLQEGMNPRAHPEHRDSVGRVGTVHLSTSPHSFGEGRRPYLVRTVRPAWILGTQARKLLPRRLLHQVHLLYSIHHKLLFLINEG